MTDSRLTPCNGRVACESLRGQVVADRFVLGVEQRVAVPVASLLRTPDGARDRQLLLGDSVSVFEDTGGWSFLKADKDGYCGYVRTAQLSDGQVATHRVSALATHVYEEASFKSRDLESLSFGAGVTVSGEEGRYALCDRGYVPLQHLCLSSEVASDPVDIALKFLGTPYLWGGNSRLGIDCSGLVQASLLACGISCPGDSDMQERTLGITCDDSVERGDLLFWKGHVAMMVDKETLVHANAFHMAVALEPLEEARARIKEQGDGEVTRYVRL